MMGMTAVGQKLHEEHLSTLGILNTLEGVILGRSADNPMDLSSPGNREYLEQLITVMDQDVTQHFGFEEEMIFPILRENGAADIAEMLFQEHEIIRPLAGHLKTMATDALQTGFDRARWSEFRARIIELMEREAFHIQKEEMGMVRVLAHFIDAETDQRLATRHAQFADEFSRQAAADPG